jgi:hypothetical protein
MPLQLSPRTRQSGHGKKRMRAYGSVSIPQEAFIVFLPRAIGAWLTSKGLVMQPAFERLQPR